MSTGRTNEPPKGALWGAILRPFDLIIATILKGK